MKKFISSTITLLLLLIIIWSITSWYFGTQAENALKSALEINTGVSGEKLFRAELIEYRRTWLGAKAKVRLSSDNIYLSERLNEIDLSANLLNGPVFLTEKGLSLGTSLWSIRVDESSLTEDQLQTLQGIFPQGLPSIDIRQDFKQRADYVAKFHSMLGKVLITGLFDLDSEDNRGAITLDDFVLGVPPNMIRAKSVNISYQHQKALTSAYNPGTSSLQIPVLEISLNSLPGPIRVSVKANSDISIDNNNLKGFIKVNAINKNLQIFPVKGAGFTLQFKGLSGDGLVQLTEARAELDNLYQQTQWLLEEQGEVPEGQDQIWLLRDQIENASKRLPQTLMQTAFNEAKAQVNFTVKTFSNTSDSTLSGEIVPADSLQSADSLISFFMARARVSLDDDLYQFVNKHFGINKKQFSFTFKQNKLLMQ
jgi:hypothetical protein